MQSTSEKSFGKNFAVRKPMTGSHQRKFTQNRPETTVSPADEVNNQTHRRQTGTNRPRRRHHGVGLGRRRRRRGRCAGDSPPRRQERGQQEARPADRLRARHRRRGAQRGCRAAAGSRRARHGRARGCALLAVPSSLRGGSRDARVPRKPVSLGVRGPDVAVALRDASREALRGDARRNAARSVARRVRLHRRRVQIPGQAVAGGGARDERRQVPDRDVPSVGAAVVRRPEDAAAREDERGLGGQAVEGLGRSNAGGIQRQIQRMERHADVAKGHLDRRRGGRGR